MAVVYTAFLAWMTWNGGADDGGEGSDPVAFVVLFFVGWAAGSALVGYLIGPGAFVVALVATAGASTLGYALDEFHNELWFFNSLLVLVISSAFIAPGVWLRARRRRRTYHGYAPPGDARTGA